MGSGDEVMRLGNFSSSTRSNVSDALGHPSFALMRKDVAVPLYVEVDQI